MSPTAFVPPCNVQARVEWLGIHMDEWIMNIPENDKMNKLFLFVLCANESIFDMDSFEFSYIGLE
jgi:hypothetical protein